LGKGAIGPFSYRIRPCDGPRALSPRASHERTMTETQAAPRSMPRRFIEQARTIFPGLLVSAAIAAIAIVAADRFGGSAMLYALLFGMPFHFLVRQRRIATGVDFSSRTILHLGVACLGARITFAQIAGLGWRPFLSVICATIVTLIMGAVFARAFKLTRELGILTGGATAICGSSAALAIASVLPRDKMNERDIIFTVIGVTALSTIAMVVYPPMGALLRLSNVDQGFFLGGTIHNVAQVVGAGYSVSREAGDIATLVKLLRVAMLLPVAVCIPLFLRGAVRPTSSPALPLPGFLFGFAVLVILGSVGVIPPAVRQGLGSVSEWLFVISIAALGVKTSLKALLQVGLRPIALMIAETIFLAVFVLLAIGFLF